MCYTSAHLKTIVLSPDYSILVENVPGNATNVQEWIDFFKSQAPLDEHGGKVADVTIALNNGEF